MPTYFWLIIALAVVGLWLIATYNRLVNLKNRAAEGWSDIDVQLKRRYDLIPNLINTVKGYASHEAKVFEAVTQARAKAIGAQTIEDRGVAENMLTDALKSLFAVAEAYPELKASANFAKLQDELTDTENKIQAARRFYNSMVRDLNTALQSFPTNLIGAAFNFTEQKYFEAANDIEKENVRVEF